MEHVWNYKEQKEINMILLLNMAATLFFLAMLGFGVSLCVLMVRRDGARMMAALAGQDCASALVSDLQFSGVRQNSESTVNLSGNPPKIESAMPWARAASGPGFRTESVLA
jgi:hypothetical protein